MKSAIVLITLLASSISSNHSLAKQTKLDSHNIANVLQAFKRCLISLEVGVDKTLISIDKITW
jgi:hypothetical protein